MFDRLISFLKDLPGGAGRRRRDRADDPRVAAAALMYHVMDADGVRQECEWERLQAGAVAKPIGVTGDELDALVAAGEEADQEAIDLYAFTSVLEAPSRRRRRGSNSSA